MKDNESTIIRPPGTGLFYQFLAHSKNELMQWRGVSRLLTFAQMASSRRQLAGSPPNLHTMVNRYACIQGVLKVKVKGHVIRALLLDSWNELLRH